MSSILDVERIEAALRRWLYEERFRSYDPYDGLSCRAPWSLVRKNRFAARLWMQFIKNSPLNLRPLFGIRKRTLTKTYSDLAAAMIVRHRLGDATAEREVRKFLEHLRREARPGYAGACWALETPYVSRFMRSDGMDPNIFWTINVANAFLDAYDVWGQEADLEIARSTVDFVLEDLGVVNEGERGVWFRYFIDHDAVVYNVVALMGTLLQRLARCTGESELETLGTRALLFVAGYQNDNGSWYYARGPSGRWVDGFHTGYILESFLGSRAFGQAAEYADVLKRGARYYAQNLFTETHVPRYSTTSLYPIDVQNCAQAIQTLAKLSAFDTDLLDKANLVTDAVIEQLFRFEKGEQTGLFAFNRGRFFSNSLPMVRWGEAPMLLALNVLLAARNGLAPPGIPGGSTSRTHSPSSG